MTFSNTSVEFQAVEPQHIGIALRNFKEELNLRHSSDNPLSPIGISTGFSDLDSLTSGLRPGSLCVIAGRPSMGKSAFALNIASHIALEEKLPVVIFSMEMSTLQISQRLVGQVGKVDSHRIRTGRLESMDEESITTAVGMLGETEIYIDDTPCLTIKQIRSKAHNVSEQHERLGLVIVDCVQYLKRVNTGVGSPKDWNMVMVSLKELAREINAPIILLSQLTRKLEKRKSKRPQFSDLPDVQIAQFADMLLFIYRDEVYDPDSPDKGTAEIIIARNQYGPIGTIRLGFKGELSSFYDYSC